MITQITLQSKEGSDSEYFDCAEVIFMEDNGTKTKKEISIRSLLGALNSSAEKKDDYFRIGRMPRGFYDGKIQQYEGILNAEIVLLLKKGKQIITLEEKRYETCVPTLVFKFIIHKNFLSSTYVFAVADDIIDDQTPLYAYPFGNVNQENGLVCWGNNKLETITGIKQLEFIAALFIQSPCNGDYFGRNVNYTGTLRCLLEDLKAYQEFPIPVLKEKHKKLRELLGD